MINLLCLLCSLCIQFVAVDVTPYNMASLNAENEFYIDEIKSRIASNYDGWWYNAYYQYLDVDNENWIVIKGFAYSGDDIVVCCPNEAVGSGSSSVYSNGYTTYQGDNNLVSTINLGINNYRGFHYSSTAVEGDVGIFGTSWRNFDGGDWSLLYCDKPIYSGETLVVDVYNAVIITTGDTFGSLSQNGHSSGSSPLESLQNFSWSAHSSTYTQTGHNTHVTPSSATPDFTNATQNLLGQIVDNTNSIIENTNSLGGALETINGNIINGSSAIFNAISQFNNNFINTYVYDEEKVNDTLENSSMFLFASTTTEVTQTIINESDVLLDAVHDMDEKQDLILYLDLTKWKVPVYSSSTGINTTYVRPYNEVVEIDFTFLKETKSIWQPILLGVLYLALFMSIYFDLPNILRGANA